MTSTSRERRITRVTIWGSVINVFLLVIKFVAGIVGHSSAMIADAVHSSSDFITDIIVVLFVWLGAKPQDEGHDYGHGKYETLATAIIGIMLGVVALMIAVNGIIKIAAVFNGETLPSPGIIALVVAIVSIVLKEWSYRFTITVAREEHSETAEANAWHHRSDAFSSIGTAAGIGGAIFLGDKWTILDPLAAVIVSFFIGHVALTLTKQALGELLDKSLSPEIESEIIKITNEEPGVSCIHHLRTRQIGNVVAIEMHIRMPGAISLSVAHGHCSNIEKRLRHRFGQGTIITIHMEPEK